GAPGGIDHQQQFHQMVLGGRYQRLNDVDIPLATVGQQLRLQAVIAEPGRPRRGDGQTELGTDAVGEHGMGAATKYHDVVRLFPPADVSNSVDLRHHDATAEHN